MRLRPDADGQAGLVKVGPCRVSGVTATVRDWLTVDCTTYSETEESCNAVDPVPDSQASVCEGQKRARDCLTHKEATGSQLNCIR